MKSLAGAGDEKSREAPPVEVELIGRALNMSGLIFRGEGGGANDEELAVGAACGATGTYTGAYTGAGMKGGGIGCCCG